MVQDSLQNKFEHAQEVFQKSSVRHHQSSVLIDAAIQGKVCEHQRRLELQQRVLKRVKCDLKSIEKRC
ncbi:hypothetical protein [Alteromonas lipotrueiana]|uniref:hypothetical protein n=1 Tax=Alteromonas lipotrueiana TaxID=2803815 RepID=UPI001C463323|nr:hypothetical protein [Alteromonas lipotrueiana]|tara:strand:- start:288 stop:491 length:204 start_codon:yes stop_codon:yes gene_type:complete